MREDPAALFATLLEEPAPAVARLEGGGVRPMPVHRYVGDASAADELVIDAALGPVLDIGCGPGRMLDALSRRQITALGLDRCPRVVAHARRRGRRVVHHDVFAGGIPDTGRWGTVLLLDGNIGIGGDPARLLRRVAQLLRPGGRIVAELDPPGALTGSGRVRLESAGRVSRWFDWAAVGHDDVGSVAERAGLAVDEVLEAQGRWFACLA